MIDLWIGIAIADEIGNAFIGYEKIRVNGP